MTIVTIALGLLGLSIVVFVHELGHMLVARLVGVDVDEFSIGMGPKLFGFKRGKTEYRLSALPIGGYCKLKGQDDFRQAVESNSNDLPRSPGSYYGAHPLRRIAILLGGPLFNVLFAGLVFITVMGFGYTIQTFDSRIILASEFSPEAGSLPAATSGLRSGDRVSAVNGRSISSFSELQEAIALSAGRTISMTVLDGGQSRSISIVPDMDKETGAGRIGIYPWIDPVIAQVNPDGAAFLAGLRAGDRLVSVNGQDLPHTMALTAYLNAQRPQRLLVVYQRDGRLEETGLVPLYGEAGPTLGLRWQTSSLQVKSANPLLAVSDGLRETGKTIAGTFRGLGSLFLGVNPLRALSGPARITWIVGQVTTDGFESGLRDGFSTAFNFLAILSIGLFIMNLLPIPVLDGGWIILFTIELIRRRPVQVKTVLRYQMIGLVAILGLFLLTTVGDILFFSGR